MVDWLRDWDRPVSDWQVARYDVNELPHDRLRLAMEWVARHGVDPKDVMPRVTVSSSDDGALRLHLSRFHRVDGKKVADHNLDVMATVPLVIDINPDDPPPWLRPSTEE